MEHIDPAKLANLKKQNSKDDLAELYLQQCIASDEIEQQLQEARHERTKVLADAEELRGALERANSKLKTIEEAIRAGLATLYPNAPVPARQSSVNQYGMSFHSECLSGEESKPEERLLIHILQEAI